MTEEPLNAPFEHNYKIVIIGDSTVGKSSLLLRFVSDTFDEDTSSSMHGLDSKDKDVVTASGKTVRLSLWDTAGQERMGFLTSSYYRGAHGIMIVYDITNEASFRNITNWLQEIDRYAYGSTMKVLVGNKSDLAGGRAVSKEKAEVFAAKELEVPYFETSAKEGQNVQDAFMNLVEKIQEKKEGLQTTEKVTKVNTLLMDSPKEPNKKRGFCSI